MKSIALLPALMLMLCLSSCQAIGDIFKAGVGVGVVVVLLVVGLIVFIVSKAGGK